MANTDSYVDWIEDRNQKPIILDEKKKLYRDIMNIEHSWTGRMDADAAGANTFIMESVQLLINAIKLFEKGYFDCAFYSIREAIEISTTTVYLSDMPYADRVQVLEAWKSTSDFPMQSKMIKQLSQKGEMFSEMMNTMISYFKDIYTVNQALNKYVHKQGLQHFYVARNNPLNILDEKILIRDFLYFLKKGISVIAVMRLAIDPFPILLLDEEIRLRVTNWMTKPYSMDFISEYIDKDVIEAYKNTNMYILHREQFMQNEKNNLPTYDVIENRYIDTNKKDDIMAQIQLLDFQEHCAVKLAFACQKVTKIYTMRGWNIFFTNRKSNKPDFPWSSSSLYIIAVNPIRLNQTYDEALISVFLINKNYFFVEHNDPITERDIQNLDKVGTNLSEKFKHEPEQDLDTDTILSLIEKFNLITK